MLWVIGYIALVLAASSAVSAVFWDWLGAGESGSTTIRNLGLIIAAVIALPLAIWRSLVAERQAETAQQGLLNERYQKGAEMLGSDVLSVRLGGIYALRWLAEEHSKQYHVQVLRLFCAFLRNPVGATVQRIGSPGSSQDVEAILEMIRSRDKARIGLESHEGYTLDLHGARLHGARLDSANLSQAKLWDADLSSPEDDPINRTRLDDANLARANLIRTQLKGADLTGARLQKALLLRANLSGTRLVVADLSGAQLHGANLTGAILGDGGTWNDKDGQAISIRLTQRQLDQACGDPEDPPALNGVVDSETGELLVWQGNPLGEQV